MKYPNLFKSRYVILQGKDWIRRIESDDIKAFVRLGLEESQYGRLGGQARAKTGKRDKKGRFVK